MSTTVNCSHWTFLQELPGSNVFASWQLDREEHYVSSRASSNNMKNSVKIFHHHVFSPSCSQSALQHGTVGGSGSRGVIVLPAAWLPGSNLPPSLAVHTLSPVWAVPTSIPFDKASLLTPCFLTWKNCQRPKLCNYSPLDILLKMPS